jgi:N-acetylmuramoyl-L-alanine amidase
MKSKISAISTIVLVMALFMVFFPEKTGAQTLKSYSIDETLKELGAVMSWDPFFSSGALNKGENRLKFYSGLPGEQGAALFNGSEVIAVSLPYIEKGTLCFPESFVLAAKKAFAGLAPALPKTDPPKNSSAGEHHFRVAAIIIDPGHGGKDSGASDTHTIAGKTLKSVEKDIVLSVGKKLAVLLNEAYPGKKILMTRKGDTYPSLADRVDIANTVKLKENEAIIYISIHANASINKTARGYEIWYLPPDTQRELIDKDKYAEYAGISHILNDMLQAEFFEESTRMGGFILNRFKEKLGNNIPSRGLKAENWYVVRNARMPAVLVELGFVSNAEDAKLMADEAYLKLFAEALYKGIVDFVAEFEKSGGYTAP